MIEIPIPVTNLEIVALAMGITFGRNFGKRLDQSVKKSKWFTGRHDVWRWLIGNILDFTHHWWIGALVWLYAMQISGIILVDQSFIMFFGVGLFVDDIRDFKHVMQRYLKGGK